MERVADYVMRYLKEIGVSHIFMVNGRGVLFLTDAAARAAEISTISTYHEQGASYAAMAYAQASGGLSACLVSTGCAASNAVTAALCAFQDNVPMIFISGQHMLHETTHYTGLPIRTYGSQEADIIRMVKPVTKYAAMLMHADDVACVLEEAASFAMAGRQGPVWIDIPLDVQNMRVDAEQLKHYEASADEPEETHSLVITQIADELHAAKRPLLLLGGGVRSAKAETLVRALVERVHIPVVFTPAGADAYGSAHALSIGAIGAIGGSRAGNFALQNADCILAIGTKLCSQITGGGAEKFAPHARITIVDIDEVEHQKKGVAFERFIHMDARLFLEAFLVQDLHETNAAWQEKCRHWKQIFHVSEEYFVKDLNAENRIDLYSFADALNTCLPDDATVITDAGFEELIIPSTIAFRESQRCLFPAAQGAMGYAVPAILGAYYAGRQEIITAVGDGSVMMNAQELPLIAAHGIPAKIFVINNNMYAVIRKRQRDLFRTRTIGNDPSDGLPAPNFAALAAFAGFAYARVERYDELGGTLGEVLASDRPVLCEVMCTPDQKYLHRSYAVGAGRRLEHRPLEDLAPFMEREMLAREMCTES